MGDADGARVAAASVGDAKAMVHGWELERLADETVSLAKRNAGRAMEVAEGHHLSCDCCVWG